MNLVKSDVNADIRPQSLTRPRLQNLHEMTRISILTAALCERFNDGGGFRGEKLVRLAGQTYSQYCYVRDLTMDSAACSILRASSACSADVF